MLLYTTVPYEMIFDTTYSPEITTKQVDGGFVELIKDGGGYSVSRVISTDLKMYLNPNLSPGARYEIKDEKV